MTATDTLVLLAQQMLYIDFNRSYAFSYDHKIKFFKENQKTQQIKINEEVSVIRK